MEAASRLTLFTRIGFAARGLLYMIIAILLAATGRAEDLTGALAYLNEGIGRVLLIVVTAGLLAYGVWRISDACLDIERHGSDGKGISQRIAAAFVGAIYLVLSWKTFELLRHATSAATTGNSKDKVAQTAFSLGGELMLLVGAAILAGVAVFQLYKAAKATFLRHLEPGISYQPWAKWSGRLGYAARGVVFLISAYFVFRAGLDHRPTEAGGMAEALDSLDSPWDLVIAGGLFCFGMFSLVEARYRVLRDVPVDRVVATAEQLRSA